MPVILNAPFKSTGTRWLVRGKSCMGFDIDGEWLPWEGGGSGMSGDVGGDFVLWTKFADNGVSVTVMSRNKVMATRRYEKAFLAEPARLRVVLFRWLGCHAGRDGAAVVAAHLALSVARGTSVFSCWRCVDRVEWHRHVVSGPWRSHV